MYRPSVKTLSAVLQAEWKKLEAEFKSTAPGGIKAYIDSSGGYDEEEQKSIKREFWKIKDTAVFVEQFPREEVELPAFVLIDDSDAEDEQFLGSGMDIVDGEGGDVQFSLRHSFRKNVVIETVTKNEELTEHMTVLLRYMLLRLRPTLDSDDYGFRKQRIQQVNRLVRNDAQYPAESFVRTLIFSFVVDETIEWTETFSPFTTLVTDMETGAEPVASATA